jgi:hypothetical protein
MTYLVQQRGPPDLRNGLQRPSRRARPSLTESSNLQPAESVALGVAAVKGELGAWAARVRDTTVEMERLDEERLPHLGTRSSHGSTVGRSTRREIGHSPTSVGLPASTSSASAIRTRPSRTPWLTSAGTFRGFDSRRLRMLACSRRENGRIRSDQLNPNAGGKTITTIAAHTA